MLLLERGKNIEHVKDYVNATKAPWEYPHGGVRTYAMEEAYPVLRRDYPLNEMNLGWWASDKDSPYTEVRRFDWYRAYQVGGRSLLWGRQSYRLGDIDLEANAREGIAIDWPIRYADLVPWYDHVERFAGISGSREGLPQLPDGEFQPPMPLNAGEVQVAARLQGSFGGRRRIIPSRTANLTQPLPGRSPCHYRNACWPSPPDPLLGPLGPWPHPALVDQLRVPSPHPPLPPGAALLGAERPRRGHDAPDLQR